MPTSINVPDDYKRNLLYWASRVIESDSVGTRLWDEMDKVMRSALLSPSIARHSLNTSKRGLPPDDKPVFRNKPLFAGAVEEDETITAVSKKTRAESIEVQTADGSGRPKAVSARHADKRRKLTTRKEGGPGNKLT